MAEYTPSPEPTPAEPGSQPYRPPAPQPAQPYPGYAPGPPYGPPPVAQPRTGVPWYVWVIGGCLGLALIIGIACVALGLAASRFVNTIAHETPVTSTSAQTFAVTGTPSLTIHNTAGRVSVTASSTGNVTVTITKQAQDSSSTAARNDLDAMNVTASQSGSTITVDATFERASTLTRRLSVDIVIAVPATANLNLRVEAGTVEIDGVSGVLVATLGAATFDAHGVTLADGSHLDVSTGDVRLGGALASGASVAVTVSSGAAELTLPSTTATHLDANVSVGGIDISGWSVPVSHSGVGAAAHGDLGANPSGTLTVHIGTGQMTLAQSS